MGIRIEVDGEEWVCEEQERKPVEIEMWYDRHLRLWTLYPIDSEGNQLDGASYAVNKKEANELKKYLEAEHNI